MTRLEILQNTLTERLGDQVKIIVDRGEVTVEIPADKWVQTCTNLRDEPGLSFEQAVDLCGVDYLTYGAPNIDSTKAFPARFAVVVHLMSVKHNWRLRVRAWVANSDLPMLASLVDVWPSLNWFEREAFDLFGIVFENHPDLRRILTDYGFIGHPFRKDFPLIGHVEMRYDEQAKRVIYQPVTVEAREVTPRIIREEGYGVGHAK